MSTEEIKGLREALGLTRTQLANELRVHRSTVQRWEAGKNRVPPHVPQFLKALQKLRLNKVRKKVKC